MQVTHILASIKSGGAHKPEKSAFYSTFARQLCDDTRLPEWLSAFPVHSHSTSFFLRGLRNNHNLNDQFWPCFSYISLLRCSFVVTGEAMTAILLKPMFGDCSINRRVTNRPYAIPHVTKRETDSGRKSGYYAAILSGKEDRGIGA